jgi:hypothetical protein
VEEARKQWRIGNEEMDRFSFNFPDSAVKDGKIIENPGLQIREIECSVTPAATKSIS